MNTTPSKSNSFAPPCGATTTPAAGILYSKRNRPRGGWPQRSRLASMSPGQHLPSTARFGPEGRAWKQAVCRRPKILTAVEAPGCSWPSRLVDLLASQPRAGFIDSGLQPGRNKSSPTRCRVVDDRGQGTRQLPVVMRRPVPSLPHSGAHCRILALRRGDLSRTARIRPRRPSPLPRLRQHQGRA